MFRPNINNRFYQQDCADDITDEDNEDITDDSLSDDEDSEDIEDITDDEDIEDITDSSDEDDAYLYYRGGGLQSKSRSKSRSKSQSKSQSKLPPGNSRNSIQYIEKLKQAKLPSRETVNRPKVSEEKLFKLLNSIPFTKKRYAGDPKNIYGIAKGSVDKALEYPPYRELNEIKTVPFNQLRKKSRYPGGPKVLPGIFSHLTPAQIEAIDSEYPFKRTVIKRGYKHPVTVNIPLAEISLVQSKNPIGTLINKKPFFLGEKPKEAELNLSNLQNFINKYSIDAPEAQSAVIPFAQSVFEQSASGDESVGSLNDLFADLEEQLRDFPETNFEEAAEDITDIADIEAKTVKDSGFQSGQGLYGGNITSGYITGGDITDTAIGYLGKIPEAGPILKQAYSVAKPIADFIQSVVPDKRLPSVKYGEKTGIYVSDKRFMRPYDYLIDLSTISPTEMSEIAPDFSNYSKHIQDIGIDVNRYNNKYFFGKSRIQSNLQSKIPDYFKDTHGLHGAKFWNASPQEIYATVQWFTDKSKQAGDLYSAYAASPEYAAEIDALPITE